MKDYYKRKFDQTTKRHKKIADNKMILPSNDRKPIQKTPPKIVPNFRIPLEIRR